MRTILALVTLCAAASSVQAHVSGAPQAQHAAEHAWLALLLLPVAGHALRLLRRRMRD